MPTDVPLVPREVLFGNPERVGPRLSPDGTRVAWLAPEEGVLNVWVGPVATVPEGARAVTRDRDRGIRTVTWAYDDRHVLYVQDAAGDENWRLHAVDLETGEDRDLTPFAEVQAQIVDVDEDFPDDVLVGLNRRDPQLHDLFRLHLPSGELTLVSENPGFVGWVPDAQWRVRGAVAPLPDGGTQIMVRETEDDEWRVLLEVGQEDSLSTAPLAFTAEGDGLYAISSVGRNAGALVRLSLAEGSEEVLAADERYDVAGARFERRTRRPQVVAFLRERLTYEVLDPAIADDLAAVLALGDGDVSLVGRDREDTAWLVAEMADDGPVRYHRYDRTSGESTFLFTHQPALDEYRLASMEAFSFTARDGLELHGYLTCPVGVERSGLPAVLNVHGGPWVRDAWGYDPEAQWFANRGYVCIQVNYRGSTGYGKAFTNAGDKAWGAEMHDDLVDAVNHVVGQGWVDRERVAIHGGSYGGYAALVGATFTPEVFRCAVDIVGPSNLSTLIRSIPPYWAPMVAQFHTRVGNPETEKDFLWSRSPLSRVDDIRIPLLIAQGANDPRVKVAEAEQIVAALEEKGIPHTYLLFPDEGHGFAKPENRLKFYAAEEAFLAEHLGGRAEPAADGGAAAEAEPAA